MPTTSGPRALPPATALLGRFPRSRAGAVQSVATMLAILSSWGCSRPGGAAGSSDGGATGDDSADGLVDTSGGDDEGVTVELAAKREVDILFVIDNSGSMGDEQGLLAQNFPTFIDVLEAPEVKANYRIGVTTTDNGNPVCGNSTSPEAGGLQLSSCLGRTSQFVFNGVPPADATATACTDVCTLDDAALTIQPTTTEFDATPKKRPWLENIEGKTNLPAGVSTVDAFQCFGPQGIAGCGFESHLESMYKAFLRAQSGSENQYGFLRSNALLSVVVVSDETDCSYNNAYKSIFVSESQGGDTVFWSDPTASQPTSAVCWRAGVVCTGGPGTYDECHASNKDTEGNVDVADSKAVLHPIKRYVDFVQELENQKREITPNSEVLVALIAGVPQGYGDGAHELMYADAADAGFQSDFGIGPGCENAQQMSRAIPPVREREFAEAFQVGGRNNVFSICDEDYSDALQAIADTISDQIKPACMTSCVADQDPVTPDIVDPDCTLKQTAPVPGESPKVTQIKECNDDGTLPDGADVCFITKVDKANVTPETSDDMSEYCIDEGWNLEFELVRREGVPAPGGTSVSATCQLSQMKKIDCPDLPG